jgi:hypothetical protein
VEPARVDAERVVAHLALLEVFDHGPAPSQLGGYDVVSYERRRRERGVLVGAAGSVTLGHRRTRRRREYVFAAVRLGSLEVYGAVRLARPELDADLFVALADAVASDERVTTLLRIIAEGFGPREFGLESALPDAAGEIVQGAADTLRERFGLAYDQLYGDHRGAIAALVSAGYPLPAELRAPAELALARRLEAEVAASLSDDHRDGFHEARAIVAEARGGRRARRRPAR